MFFELFFLVCFDIGLFYGKGCVILFGGCGDVELGMNGNYGGIMYWSWFVVCCLFVFVYLFIVMVLFCCVVL